MTLLVVEVERDEDVDSDNDPNCYTKVCNRHSICTQMVNKFLVYSYYTRHYLFSFPIIFVRYY